MSKGKQLVAHWSKWMKDNMNIIRRAGPSDLGKERSYKNVATTQQFLKIDDERHRRRLNLIDNQKKSRKKLIENQLRLLDTSDQFLKDIQDSEMLSEDDKKQAIDFISNKTLDPKERSKMVKLREISKISNISTFEEYKQLFQIQKSGLNEISDKEEVKSMNKEQLAESIDNLQEQIEEIGQELSKHEGLKLESDELSASHVVLEGIPKMAISNMALYYENRIKMDHGTTVHPESMDTLEKITYALDHNLPVRRDLLYE